MPFFSGKVQNRQILINVFVDHPLDGEKSLTVSSLSAIKPLTSIHIETATF